MTDMQIKVEGLDDFRRRLKVVETTFPGELRKALNDVAEIVAVEARKRVPVVSGRLRDSIKPASTQRFGQVKMGTAKKVPYAGWIEFGGRKPHPRPVVRAGRYIFPAFVAKRAAVNRRSVEVVEGLARRAGLT